MVLKISKKQARDHLTGQLGLRQTTPYGAGSTLELLERLRCVQLDPLDVVGTNADLVAMARIDGMRRGDIHRHLHPGSAFEHFAKERCVLPAEAFPYYRERMKRKPDWRLSKRLRGVPETLLAQVLDEVRRRGPLGPRDFGAGGAVARGTGSAWSSNARMTTLALEVLCRRCQLVVCGRPGGGKLYDLPHRALGEWATAPAAEFGRWALLERVEAAGLLSRTSGPWWSAIKAERTSGLVEALIEERHIEEVAVEGSSRRSLAPRGFLERSFPEQDDRLRILGPLDPLVWNRKLVQHAFDFEYVWEVYKPAHKRRWGWYVCPILHRGLLVGRLEARVRDGVLVVDGLWTQGGLWEVAALDGALEAHALACGASTYRRPERPAPNP